MNDLVRNNFEVLYFSVPLQIAQEGGNSLAGGYFTCVVLHCSRIYHQEHATEPRRLPEDVAAAWGAIILLLHGDADLYK